MQATYCVRYKKMTGNNNPKVSNTKNERLMLKSILFSMWKEKT